MWYHKHCVSVTYYNLLSTLQLYCQPFWLLSWHAPRAPPSHRSLSIYCTWLLYYLVGPFLSSLGSFSNAFLNTDCYARLWRNSGKQIIHGFCPYEVDNLMREIFAVWRLLVTSYLYTETLFLSLISCKAVFEVPRQCESFFLCTNCVFRNIPF